MKTETKWTALVVNGPLRQHLMQISPRERKRDVWAECLKVYEEVWRVDRSDLTDMTGYLRLSEDWRSGRVRPVKVTISWENAR